MFALFRGSGSTFVRRAATSSNLTRHAVQRSTVVAVGPHSTYSPIWSTMCSPALRHFRWQIISRAGLLLTGFGLFRALEERQQLYATHAELEKVYEMRSEVRELPSCPIEDRLLTVVAESSAPGDLLSVLDFGKDSLNGRTVAAIFERLATMAGEVNGLCEVVLQHPTVADIGRTASPAFFEDVNTMARFLKAAGTLGVGVAKVTEIVAAVVEAVNDNLKPSALTVVAEALAAVGWHGSAAYWYLAYICVPRLAEFGMQELMALVGAYGRDPAHAEFVAQVTRELAVRKAGVDAGLYVVGATSWLRGEEVPRATRHAMLYNITSMLRNDTLYTWSKVTIDQLAAVLSIYGSNEYVASRVIGRLVAELLKRRNENASLGQTCGLHSGLADVFHALHSTAHTKAKYMEINGVVAGKVRQLAEVLVADARTNIDAYAAHELPSVAWLMASTQTWNRELAEHIVRTTDECLDTLSTEALLQLCEALVQAHVSLGQSLDTTVLRRIRYAASSTNNNAALHDKMHISLALNKARVPGLSRLTSASHDWTGISSPGLRDRAADRLRCNAIITQRKDRCAR